MKISLSTSILFAVCSVGWLNYISGSDPELNLAENWRRESGKRPLTDAEKKTELREPELVEALLLNGPTEKKKSRFSLKKTDVPKCYTKKFAGLAKSSIKHEVFSTNRISIPKTKGIYEEHSVGFSFFVAAPKLVQMIKCSCKLMTFAKPGVEFDENHSSMDSGDSADPYTPSNVEIGGETPRNSGSPPFSGINEHESEEHSPVHHEVLHTQTSEHGHYEANQAFTQHEYQTKFSQTQGEGSSVTQNHNNVVNTHPEIQRADHDSSSAEDKDKISPPKSPTATSVGWGQSFKKLWSWGGTKTNEENQDAEHKNNAAIDQHKEVAVQTEIGSSQKTVQSVQEDQFIKKTEEERLELSHHKVAIEKEKSMSHDHSSASVSSYRESSAQVEHTQIGGLKQIESQHFTAEHEYSSTRAKDKSSSEEAEKIKMVASGSVTQTEGMKYLSSEKKVDSEQVTEKMVVDESKEKKLQSTTSNAPSASPGIIGGLMGRVGGLFSYYTTPTKKNESSSSEEDGMNGKLIIVPARISGYDEETKHAGNALGRRVDVFQEKSTESFHTMAHAGETVSITAHRGHETVTEYLGQEKHEKSSSEGDRSARDVKVVLRLPSSNSSPHHLDGNYEEHIKRTNFHSLSQEDKEYKLSEDQAASDRRDQEKEFIEESNKDLIILSSRGKEIHESDSTSTRILLQSHSENVHAELNETKKKKDKSIATSSSSSSSSSQSDDEEGTKKKMNKHKEGLLEEPHGGESGDLKLDSKRMKTYKGEILEEKNENIPSINIDQKESKSDKSTEQEADTRDHHFEMVTNAQVQGIPFEQSIKVENSKSSEEKTTHRVILEETLVEGKPNHHHFSEHGDRSEESSKSDMSPKSQKQMFGKSDEVIEIEGELYKRVGSARKEQLHLPSSDVPQEEHYVKKVQEEVNESSHGEIVGKDSSSSSESKSKQDRDTSDQSAHKKLFRRSPAMPQQEKRYRYAHEVPADSICVHENGEQVLYLSKGHVDGKSFFVYRKTKDDVFYAVAYIVLK